MPEREPIPFLDGTPTMSPETKAILDSCVESDQAISLAEAENPEYFMTDEDFNKLIMEKNNVSQAINNEVFLDEEKTRGARVISFMSYSNGKGRPPRRVREVTLLEVGKNDSRQCFDLNSKRVICRVDILTESFPGSAWKSPDEDLTLFIERELRRLLD